MLDFMYGQTVGWSEHSWYATAWQAVLTADFRVPSCSRTNTELSDLYLFLTCTIPPRILHMHKNTRGAITITECVERTGDFFATVNCTLLSRARIRARFISNIEQQSFRSDHISVTGSIVYYHHRITSTIFESASTGSPDISVCK